MIVPLVSRSWFECLVWTCHKHNFHYSLASGQPSQNSQTLLLILLHALPIPILNVFIIKIKFQGSSIEDLESWSRTPILPVSSTKFFRYFCEFVYSLRLMRIVLEIAHFILKPGFTGVLLKPISESVNTAEANIRTEYTSEINLINCKGNVNCGRYCSSRKTR